MRQSHPAANAFNNLYQKRIVFPPIKTQSGMRSKTARFDNLRKKYAPGVLEHLFVARFYIMSPVPGSLSRVVACGALAT